jgi:hypothetical protein
VIKKDSAFLKNGRFARRHQTIGRRGWLHDVLMPCSLMRWVDWCDGVGTMLIDDAINIDA